MNDMFFDDESKMASGKDIDSLMAKCLNKGFRGYSKKSVQNLLEETCQSAEDMRNNLEKQIRDLFNEKSTLSQECSLLRDQLAGVEGKYEKKAEELQALLETERDEGNSLRGELAQLKKENKNLSDELAGKMKEQEDIRQLNEDLMASGNELKKIIRELKITEEALKKTKGKLEKKNQQLAELNNELTEKDDQLNMLKNEMDDLIQKYNDNSARQYEVENMELSKEIERLKDNNLELNGKINDERNKACSMKKSMQEQISYECNRADEIKKSMQKMEDEFKELKKQSDKSEDRIHALEEEKANNMEVHKELEDKHNTLHENYSSLIQKHDELTTEKEGLLHLVNMYQKKEQEYALTYIENEEYLKTIHGLEDVIEVVLFEMEEQRNLFNDLVSQYDNGKSEIYRLVQENIQTQIKNIELLDQINILTSKLTKLEEENGRVSKRIDRLNSNVRQLRENEDHSPNSESDFLHKDGNKIAFDAIKRTKKIGGYYAFNEKDNEYLKKETTVAE